MLCEHIQNNTFKRPADATQAATGDAQTVLESVEGIDTKFGKRSNLEDAL